MPSLFFVLVVATVLVVVVATAVRKQRSPEKSLRLCLLNVLLYPLMRLRIGPFAAGPPSLEKALKQAMAETGLSDAGDAHFLQNYRALTDTAAAKSQVLTPLGFLSHAIELNMAMSRRLRQIDFAKRFPQVSAVPVREPVFVLGMPRTGTTFLHRLLSLDPAVRAPLTWELLDSVPAVPATASRAEMLADAERRKNRVKALIEKRQSMGDKALQNIHEVGHDLPEECLLSLSDEVPLQLSLMFPLSYNNKDYFAIGFENFVRAYRHHKQMLQILSLQAGETDEKARRWVLKCPIHLFHIKELLTVYPDAKIIWTHRHPVSSISSMCSLTKALHSIYYEPESRDDAKIGWGVKDIFEKTLNTAADDLQARCPDAHHVTYEQLVKDPLGVVKQIYAQYNWPFTAEYEQILLRHLAEDKAKREEQKRKNKESGEVLHAYTPEDFSLTKEELSTGEFAKYVERFNIPATKN